MYMKLFLPLLKIQNQLRIFHWQTTSYAQHKAFGKAYETLDELIDQFIEVCMGKYGRSKAISTFSLELVNLDDNYLQIVDSFITYLVELTTTADPALDTDLLNIRDEMLGVLNRLKYLLTLD